ncbi:hypothetical protein HGM15179_020399 [Zosterops borbonicus]|uniref:Uncharacterized protein n=1 Tax=Zosterops borbonicus TaxID=364589 RepID=A0A8K1D705_9PASS|nr:hypothetical protein HGM15179_020399 [Zosterops borbonicus]
MIQISFWKEVKRIGIASGDTEGGNRISVPMPLLSSENWQQGGRTIAAFPVLRDVIDADYTGQIYAMMSTPTSPVTIPAKTHIAQLIPLKSYVPKTGSKLGGDRGFGSMREPQVYWTQVISDQRSVYDLYTYNALGNSIPH